MKRVNLILSDPKYRSYLEKLESFEKYRIFCNHTMEHFLDTARIMYILSLEKGLNISKEIIYATALLHDIGRVDEYESGIPHNEGSAVFAKEILPRCSFTEEETEEIISAILSHRSKGSSENILGELLYTADKKSRLCFSCKAQKECNWTEEKRNTGIVI